MCPPREKAGLFFVLKKDGDSLRLVIDARRSNSWFADVDPVELASGSLFGELEVEASEKDLFVWTIDIDNASWRFELPSELRDLFWLPEITAGVL